MSYLYKNIIKKKQFIILVFLFVIIFSFNCYAEEQLNYNEDSDFTIIIPKEIQIDANTGEATYSISAKGNISNDQKLSITPETNFYLKENGGKNDINGFITQNNSNYYYTELQGEGTEYTGKINISNLSAGEWLGTFNFLISLSKHIHDYTIISETEATCTTDGHKTHLCNDCGYIYNEKTISAIGHKYSSVYTPPTETTEGYITYTCQNCGDNYIVYDKEHIHNYNSNTTIIPTCTTNGEITHTCNDCYDSYTEIIPAIGHNYISEITKKATCTENGLITYTCNNCGDTNTKVIDALGHDYVCVITKEPTYAEIGIKTYTCSRCGDTYTESIPMKTGIFSEMSWADISAVSEAGRASSMFSLGDEKELQIGDEIYHIQILGFNHDDLSDGSGKAGITVGLKEIMTTDHNMNSAFLGYPYGDNIGGWKDSEMRTYLQNDVLASLPSDLQSAIKTVDKISDIGNKDASTLITTQDKLFLFSSIEVYGNSFISFDVDDQGTKYDFFSNDASRIKYKDGSPHNWWLRSANTFYTNSFCLVCDNGGYNGVYAYQPDGVVFGFCI